MSKRTSGALLLQMVRLTLFMQRGQPATVERIAQVMRTPRETVRDWMEMLHAAGYAEPVAIDDATVDHARRHIVEPGRRGRPPQVWWRWRRDVAAGVEHAVEAAAAARTS